MKFIAALNSLNTPWIALIVIALGMVFDVLSHRFGLGSDSATGVIGAGIGLLTGQALNGASHLAPLPITPAEPASNTEGKQL